MLTRNSTPARKTGRVYVTILGMLLCASAPSTRAAGADSADALAAGAPLYGYFRAAPGGASVPAQRLANLDQIARTDDATRVSFGSKTTRLTAGAPARVTVQALALAARYPAGSTLALGAPVDATPSDLLTRLHYAFASDLGLSTDRARQAEREVLLRNSDALIRGNIRLTLGTRWPVFMYADIGAADSALKWQGLAGIRSGHGLDLLAGWRHVTYHFSPGTGYDSLDFDGPFLGATLAW